MSDNPLLQYFVVPNRGARDSLVNSPTNPSSASNFRTQTVTRTDKVDVQIRFYDDTATGDLAVKDYGDVYVYFCGRTAQVTSSPIMFLAGPAVRTVVGEDVYYLLTVDLNTVQIGDSLGNAESVNILGEIHVQSTGGVQFTAAQFTATLYDNVFNSSEPPTSAADWPSAAAVIAAIAEMNAARDATITATSVCVTTTANCVTVTNACSIAISEANTATAAALAAADTANAAAANVAAVLAGITWDDDQLVVNGITGPHLRGPMGTLAGANGFIQVTGSRNLDATDNGCVLYSTSGTGYTLTLPSTLGSFMCLVVQQGAGQITFAAGAGATVTNEWTYTKTRTTGSHAQIIATAPGVGTTSGSMA